MDIILETAKRYYEENSVGDGKQLYDTLFPTDDSSIEVAFSLDTLIQDPYGITYRDTDMQSGIREYQPGVGQVIQIPRASEKTALSETLLEKVAAGVQPLAGFTANEAKIIGDITRQHNNAHLVTKNKQAIEVIETGVFKARGNGGSDLGLDITYSRDSALALTYDFTQVGAKFLEAVSNQQEELRMHNTPLGNMCMLLGQSWLTQFTLDDDATKLMLNNSSNTLLVTQMQPQLLAGTNGLYVIGQVRGKGMLAPVWLTSYSPGHQYKASKASAGAPYLADNKAVMFSLDDTRYSVKRGVSVRDENGKVKRVVGDMVVDKFTTEDPVTTFLRSSTRHAFVPANINHTSVITGTF